MSHRRAHPCPIRGPAAVRRRALQRAVRRCATLGDAEDGDDEGLVVICNANGTVEYRYLTVLTVTDTVTVTEAITY